MNLWGYLFSLSIMSLLITGLRAETGQAMKKPEDEKISRYFDNIHTSAERLTSLLNDLLDLSKLQAGKTILDLAEHDLAGLIKNAVIELSSLLMVKRIFVVFTPDGSYLCVVEDQGVGIPDDQRDETFDEFIQITKTSSTAGGTGLGLAISQHFIKLHQGKIWVESPPQNKSVGSVF